MTIANEMAFKGVNPYLKLSFVEFLEFIGRLGQEKYKEEDWPLFEKIEKILD